MSFSEYTLSIIYNGKTVPVKYSAYGFSLMNNPCFYNNYRGQPLLPLKQADYPKFSNDAGFSSQYYLDQLLCCYYSLSKQLKEGLKPETETFGHIATKISTRQKEGKQPPFFIEEPTGKKGIYELSSFSKLAVIDLTNKVYGYRYNTNKILSLEALGVPCVYQDNIMIEDYMTYEYRTCINLAIEITAAYIHFNKERKKLPADPVIETIADRVLSVFSNSILPFLVCSPFILTRNSLAHQFFRRLLHNYTILHVRSPEAPPENVFQIDEIYTLDGPKEFIVGPPKYYDSSAEKSFLDSRVDSIFEQTLRDLSTTIRNLGFVPITVSPNFSDCRIVSIAWDEIKETVSRRYQQDGSSDADISSKILKTLGRIELPFCWPNVPNSHHSWTLFCNSKHDDINELLSIIKTSPHPQKDSVSLIIQVASKGSPGKEFNKIYPSILDILKTINYNI